MKVRIIQTRGYLAVTHVFKGNFWNFSKSKLENLDTFNFAVTHGFKGQFQNREVSVLVCLKKGNISQLGCSPWI